MRTNIEVDDKLLEEAMKATGAKTIRETIEIGLAALVKLKRQERLRKYRGNLKWTSNLDQMRHDT